ncbi:MAG: LacI family DNA-binding transcriptional regulator, partial [Planctomycetota bacterium]
MQNNVTQAELAEHLGVTQRTISTAFGAKGRISERMRKRVLDAAVELGYRPYSNARTMRTGRLGQIAMLTRSQVGPLQMSLNKGAFMAASERDLHLTYAELDYDRLIDPNYAPKVLSELCVDGFVVHYAWDIPADAVGRVCGYGLPIVWANTRGSVGCVYPDDEQGARVATQSLLAAGHRRVMYVRQRIQGASHYSIQSRRVGYIAEMQEAGLTPMALDVDQPPDDFNQQIQYWRQLLMSHPQVTAVICYAARETNPLLIAAASLGRRVPEELSVITFAAGKESQS